VYSSVSWTTTGGQTCLTPGTELANGGAHVTLADYSPKALGSKVTVRLSNLPGGWMYVNTHLDYGLKGTPASRLPDCNSVSQTVSPWSEDAALPD
jgi:hypothetical protein